MCKQFFIILIILKIINLSVQQSCKSYCVSDTLSHKNCVNKYEIIENATINEIDGTVDFQFDFVCEVEKYEIELFYNKNTCNSANFKKHSDYMFYKLFNFDEMNIEQPDKCSEKGRVVLQNIQTGCYQIRIFNNANYNLMFKNISYWQTSYIKQKLNISLTNIIHSSRNNGTELLLQIQNPILNSYPEISLEFECKNCFKYINNHMYKLLQDKNDSTKLILNPKDNNTHLNIFCNLKYETKYGTAFCFISPINISNYNIIIGFIGDLYKCVYNKPETYKINITNIVVKADELLLQTPTNSVSEIIFGPVLGVIYIILSFFFIVIIIKLTKVKIRKIDKNPNNIDDNVDDGLSKNEIKPALLLLYPRNSEDIMSTLSSFRNIFKYQGIQIYDVYDPKRLKEIQENQCNWILKLISRKDIKIIIFLTPNGRSISHLPQEQHSIDTIYPFAIDNLFTQILKDSDFFRKIIVAHFTNDVYDYSDYDVFSTYLRFRVPDDILELFQYILKTEPISLNIKSNNEYNKLRENCEKYQYLQEHVTIHI